MEQLIPVINKLQDVFQTIGYNPIDLPQIVVVGSQSSGKSSVLENIVTRDFLPRGNDIVTRRPLVLQLVHETYQNAMQLADVEEWGEFLHLPQRKFTDFTDIRREIEQETARVAGNNKGISKSPIYLKIHSTHVLNLTLIDLPGITKLPVGDQPQDIEQQIRSLLYDYAAKPNSIILAVTPANNDLVNSEALKFAREVDPEGERTIGVLTKLDLMDHGTHALDILCNKGPFRLKLGFIGVVNRGQRDILENKPIRLSLEHEIKFFKSHPFYRTIAHRCGTPFLTKTLNTVLMHHIRDQLPELRSKINALVVSTQQELLSYGDPNFQGQAHQGTMLLRLLTKFANDFCDSIDGTSKNVSTLELSGGARVNYIFNEIYANALHHLDACGGLTTSDIRTVIRNATGPRSALFVPEISFDILVKRQIAKLEIPGMRCMELVFDELQGIVNQCERKELLRFPALHQKVIEVASEIIRERLQPTSAMIENLVQIELGYINTSHPDFMGPGAAISALGKMHDRRTKLRNNGYNRASSDGKKSKSKSSGSQQRPMIEAADNSNVGSPATESLAINKPKTNGSTRNANHQIDRPRGHGGMVGAPGTNGGGLLNFFFGGLHDATPPLSRHGTGDLANSRHGPGQRRSSTGATTASAASQPASSSVAALRASNVHIASDSPVRAMAPPARAPQSRHDQLFIEDDAILDRGLSQLDLEEVPLTDINEFDDPNLKLSEKEEMETQLIRTLLQSYFNIVRKNLLDSVPKTIMHFLVNYSKENLQNRLVSELYREDLFSVLLREDEQIARDRTKCKAALDALRRASAIVNEVRDANILKPSSSSINHH